MNSFFGYVDKNKSDDVISFINNLQNDDAELVIGLNMKPDMLLLYIGNDDLNINEVHKRFPIINVFNADDEIIDAAFEIYIVSVLENVMKHNEWYDIYNDIIGNLKRFKDIGETQFSQLVVDKVVYYFDNFYNLINNIEDTIFSEIEENDVMKTLIVYIITCSILHIIKNDLPIKPNVLYDFYENAINELISSISKKSIMVAKNM